LPAAALSIQVATVKQQGAISPFPDGQSETCTRSQFRMNVLKAEPHQKGEINGGYYFCPACTSTNVRRRVRFAKISSPVRQKFSLPAVPRHTVAEAEPAPDLHSSPRSRGHRRGQFQNRQAAGIAVPAALAAAFRLIVEGL
jgi:hypothetical protein